MARKPVVTDFNQNFLDFAKAIRDEDTRIASEGLNAAEFTGYIDTGCYILNGLVSGTIYGGVHNNKITVFAGESSTGKTFLVLGIVKNFLDSNPRAGVIYYDTEAAVTKDMMLARGIDPTRVITSEPSSIQDFNSKFVNMVNKYISIKESERPPMIAVLDSLSMLPTAKELKDAVDSKETKDMTKASLIRGMFRMITLKCAKAKLPLLVTTHTYTQVGAYVPTQTVSGGGGVMYPASTVVKLSKKKDRDDKTKEVLGNLITMQLEKGRLAKESAKATARLTYERGLDKYYGLLELADDYKIFKKISRKYELPNGDSRHEDEINQHPEEVFTSDVLKLLDDAAKKEFTYGSSSEVEREVKSGESNDEGVPADISGD